MISVFVTTYNRPQVLERCLRSLQPLRGPECRLEVIHDRESSPVTKPFLQVEGRALIDQAHTPCCARMWGVGMLNHAYRMAARRKSEAMIWVRDHAVLVKPVAPFHLVPASGGLVLFTQGKQILGGSFRLDFVERHLDGVFLHRGFTNSFALSDLLDRMERVPGSAGTVVRSEGVLTCPDSQESSDQADVEVERWLRRDFHIYSQRRKQRGQPPLARRPS